MSTRRAKTETSTKDLLMTVIRRMEQLQAGESACREYAEVLMKSKKALQWLEKKV